MMGRRNRGQGQLFYEFHLDEAVPEDHLVRKIAALLDLLWAYTELAPYYSAIGRPSIDPVLMIRMLIIGYVFAIRSEQQIYGLVEFRPVLGFAHGEPTSPPQLQHEKQTQPNVLRDSRQ